MRDENFRRHQEEVKKERAKKVCSRRLMASREPSKEEIGKMASVHCADCSCPMCGNPRKHFGQKTMQELKLENIKKILSDFEN